MMAYDWIAFIQGFMLAYMLRLIWECRNDRKRARRRYPKNWKPVARLKITARWRD